MVGHRILLVEDNKDLREDFTELFMLDGYEVYAAMDGRQALAILQDHPVDIIISDYDMPNMNGYELLQAVRGDSNLADTPFLMFSGAQTPNFPEDKNFHFLRKPVRINVLIDTVNGLIKG